MCKIIVSSCILLTLTTFGRTSETNTNKYLPISLGFASPAYAQETAESSEAVQPQAAYPTTPSQPAFAAEGPTRPSATASIPVYAEGDATTSVGGGTFNLNTLLGANRYYTNGITGQGTVAVNLEAGHIWNGHEALQHVNTFYASSSTWRGGDTTALIDRHATQAALFIGGRMTEINPSIRQQGLAYGTDLRSAAIATIWSGNAYALGFSFNSTTVRYAYNNTFGLADVINSSYGFSDAPGTNSFTVLADAMSYQNSKTLHVVSAGNSGSGSNTVQGPGSGYNILTVGALNNANNFNTVASFSSRSPQTFSGGGITVNGVRAAVDLVAPGSLVTTAYYGGQTGGNNTSLSGSTNLGTNDNAYTNVSGTSFAAPIVAGGAALVYSAAKTLPGLSNNAEATENMVVKALLLTGADKTSGWSNGQFVTNGITTTTQSLDWAAGAGRMNLDKTYDIQVNGQTGVGGQNQGNLGTVKGTGWDHGSVQLGVANNYILGDILAGGSTFSTTLSWMRNRTVNVNGTTFDNAQADLNLSLWLLGSDNSFQVKVAESISLYNTVEHLYLALPSTGLYGLRILYGANTFGSALTYNLQDYGIAWDGSEIYALYWTGTSSNNTLNWNGTNISFSTNSAGTSPNTAATTQTTQIVLSNSSSGTNTITVDGNRAAAGLLLSAGNLQIGGTNSGTLTLMEKGLTNAPSVNGVNIIKESLEIALGGNQAWVNQSAHNLQVNSAVSGTGNLTLRADSAGTINLSGNVNHTGALTNAGTETGTVTVSGTLGANITAVTQASSTSRLTLSGSNLYAGPTTVQAGTLELASTTGGAAGNTSLVSVNLGATLLISQSHQVNDTANISLSGGTIHRANGVSEVFGNLSLLGNSTLDFGSGASGSLTFGTYFQTESALLTVNNFFGGNTLSFASDLSGQILTSFSGSSYKSANGLFSINSLSGGFTSGWNGSTFTITAIPEPSAYLVALGLLALGLLPSRRQLVRDTKKILGLKRPMREHLENWSRLRQS